MQQENLMKNIEELRLIMPEYVNEYYLSKLAIPYSYKTLYEYLKEYKRFFEWMIDSDIVQVKKISEIELNSLETLKKKDMESFIIFLRERNLLNGNDKRKGLSQSTINRTLTALSSLFTFLTEEVEDEDGEPYFYRNVMKKIKTNHKKETLASKAESLKPKLFLGDETQEFLDYIVNKYPTTLSPRAATSYKKNVERDLAIISLILASGLRLSELTNLDLKDINLNLLTADVIRKGNKRDTVHIAPFAKPYLEEYLKIRQQRYSTSKEDTALFVTETSGRVKRIGNAAVENLVAKYSEGFKIRVTPHKLRHTLATRLYGNTKSLLLTANQLGHSSVQIVGTYAHVVDDEQKDALDKL